MRFVALFLFYHLKLYHIHVRGEMDTLRYTSLKNIHIYVITLRNIEEK